MLGPNMICEELTEFFFLRGASKILRSIKFSRINKFQILKFFSPTNRAEHEGKALTYASPPAHGICLIQISFERSSSAITDGADHHQRICVRRTLGMVSRMSIEKEDCLREPSGWFEIRKNDSILPTF